MGIGYMATKEGVQIVGEERLRITLVTARGQNSFQRMLRGVHERYKRTGRGRERVNYACGEKGKQLIIHRAEDHQNEKKRKS